MGVPEKTLILRLDGSSKGNPGPATIGVVIRDGAGKLVAKFSEHIGVATNNEAEYKALIAGLQRASQIGAKQVIIRLDSELVVKQLEGEYRVKKAHLKPLFQKASRLLEDFDSFRIDHVSREQNREAHRLAKRQLDVP